MVVVKCPAAGCDYQTSDQEASVVAALLHIHALSHPQATVSARPKLDRPHIDIGVEQEIWNNFVRRWEAFRTGSNISVDAASTQLLQCASKALGDRLLKSDPSIQSRSMQEVLAVMQSFAVPPVPKGVIRAELMQLQQAPGEQFRTFAARVQGKAKTCGFSTSVMCRCGETVKADYTLESVRDVLLAGIADVDIRREALCTEGILTKSVNEVIAFIEGREMARNAKSLSSLSAFSSFTESEVDGQDKEEEDLVVKFEGETDTEVDGDGIEEEEPIAKSEVETGTTRHWPTTGSIQYYSTDEPAVKEVKIEIDVAEDPSLYWGMKAEQHTSGHDELSKLREKLRQQRLSASSAVSGISSFTSDSCGRLKQETAEQLTEATYVNPRSESNTGIDCRTSRPAELKKQTAEDCSSSSTAVESQQTRIPHVCQQCGVTFTHSWDFKQHMLIHTREKPHKCLQCNVEFRRYSNLKQHMTIHTGEKPHKCGQCSAAFRSSSYLKKHILIHTGEKPYKCLQCFAEFSYSSCLKKHKMIHTGEKPHKCLQCSAAFIESGHLKTHMMIHTGEKPHECQLCFAVFRHSGAFKQHVQIHTGEKPHKCPQCVAAFRRSSDLKKHMLIHSGEKPHKCLQCGAAFRESSTLKKHILIHTGEKPYKCLECGADFRQSVALKKHMLIHTGEKPHKCLHCFTAFRHSSTLKKHMVVHIGE